MNKRMFFNKSHSKKDLSDGKGPMSGFLENPLDSFFPFDPFLLKRSKPFVEGYYFIIFYIFESNKVSKWKYFN